MHSSFLLIRGPAPPPVRASPAEFSSALPSLRCFFFNDPPATEICTLSLHDALPIWKVYGRGRRGGGHNGGEMRRPLLERGPLVETRVGAAPHGHSAVRPGLACQPFDD